MRIIQLIIGILLLILQIKAQQVPINSQYVFDKYMINTGYAGSYNIFSASLNVRQQFAGLEGAPTTEMFCIHMPISGSYMGIGLKGIHDQIGITHQTSLLAAYSYQIGLGDGKMAFSLEGGFLSNALRFTDLESGIGDPNVPTANESKLVPDANFSTYFFTERFYAGYSLFHLIKSKISFAEAESKNKNGYLSKHHFFMAGYNLKITEDLVLEPFFLFKKVYAAPTQFDVGTIASYKNFLNIGFLYRTGDAMAFILKYVYKEQYKLSYSYDYSISSLSSYITGGHEIMLSYTLKLLPPAGKVEVHPIYPIKD